MNKNYKWFLTMLLFLTVYGVAYSQVPANDACDGATVITPADLSYEITQDASNATNNDGFLVNGDDNPFMNDGVWYKFTPNEDGMYKIIADPDASWDCELGLFSGSCESLTYVNNIDYGVSNDPETLVQSLKANIDYYINIGHYSSSVDNPEGEFTLSLAMIPDNDTCKNAIEITPESLPYATIQDATGATNNDGFLLDGDDNPFMNDGVWYKFTPSEDGQYKIVANTTDWYFDLGLFTGDCDNLTYVAKGVYTYVLEGDNKTLIQTLTADTDYYINIGHYSNSTDRAEGEFGLTLEKFTPLANDACDGAIEITPASLPYEVYQDASDATNQRFLPDENGDPIMNDGVWYKFTPDETDTYLISVNSYLWEEIALGIYTGDCTTPVFHDGITYFMFNGYDTTQLVAGTEYYINIGYPDGTGDYLESEFTLKLEKFTPLANDACGGAIEIASTDLPYITTQDASGATNNDGFLVNGDDNPFMNDGVWYKFTPSEDAEYTINATPNSWDAEIVIYSGDCDNLTYIDYADDPEILVESLTADTDYYINIGHYGTDDESEGEFTLQLLKNEVPANDACNGATEITQSQIPYTITQNDAINATNNDGFLVDENGDPFMNDGVWYKFAPTQTRDFRITVTPNSNWNCEIGVFSGSCGSLDFVENKNDADGYTPEQQTEVLDIALISGNTYYINIGQASGYDDNIEGSFTLNIEYAPDPLANDACSGAFVVGALPYTTTQDASEATNESFLTNGSSLFMNDGVWYEFTPGATEDYRITVSPTDWDCEIGLFSGDCGNLQFMANKNENGTSNSEILTIGLAADVTYYINIGEQSPVVDNPEGEFTLNIDIAPEPLANDACSGAVEIAPANLPYSVTLDASAATNNGGFLSNGTSPFMNDGAWYEFTPTNTHAYILTANPSGWDCEIGIFTGSCGSLTYFDSKNDATSGETETITVDFFAGTTYYINIGEESGNTNNPEGEFTLTLELVPDPPANDACDGAIEITASSLPYNNTQDATGATNNGAFLEDGSGNPMMNDGVWYKFTPAETKDYKITVTPDNWDCEIGIYSGDCTSLTFVGNKDDVAENLPEVFTQGLISGTSYYINIGHNSAVSNEMEGEFTISLKAVDNTVPANDACEGAIQISTFALPYQNSQDASAATNNDGFLEDASSTAFMNDGVWYKFTPSTTDDYKIVVTPTGWDCEIGLFSGECGLLSFASNKDDAGVGIKETMVIELTGSQQYYINVGHKSESMDEPEGDFTIRLEVDAAINGTTLENNLMLYPNPATDILFVEIANNNNNNSIEIIDLSGKIIFSKTITDNKTSIDISSYAKGMYFVRNGKNIKKLVVK